MSGKGKEAGVLAARRLMAQLQPEPVPPPPPAKVKVVNQGNSDVVEAVEALTEEVTAFKQAVPPPPDMSPVVEAINNIQTTNQVTVQLEEVAQALKESGNVDTSGIELNIKALKRSIDDNNSLMKEMISVSRSKRSVKYDSEGRIIEISVG